MLGTGKKMITFHEIFFPLVFWIFRFGVLEEAFLSLRTGFCYHNLSHPQFILRPSIQCPKQHLTSRNPNCCLVIMLRVQKDVFDGIFILLPAKSVPDRGILMMLESGSLPLQSTTTMAGIGRQVDSEGLLDRISNLPDHLIDRIIGKLPLSAVVRTSILSKRWKDCWKRLRKIEPDMCFFNEFIQMDSAIYAILVLHNGPLDEFILIVPFSARACHLGDASKWLMLMSKKNIKDLTLCGFSENRITIPSHIFSSLGLKSLHLIACDIKPLDSFGGFRDLTSLTLDDVIIPDALLQILISNSPLLEALKLTSLASGDPVVVDGPKLRKLMFISETRPLLLKYSPSCTEVQIESELIVPLNRSGQSKLNEFVCLLPKVEKLNLAGVSLNSLGVGFARVQFPSTLHHLKHLELTFFDSSSTTHISSAFYLIQSAPNLESLGILIHWTYFREENEAAASMLKAQERACNLSRLRKVEFTNLHVSENELLLVKAALRCFPMLETVTVNGGLYLSKEEELCVVERLLELQVPGSPVFKFRYIGNEPAGHLFNCQEGDLYWRVN